MSHRVDRWMDEWITGVSLVVHHHHLQYQSLWASRCLVMMMMMMAMISHVCMCMCGSCVGLVWVCVCDSVTVVALDTHHHHGLFSRRLSHSFNVMLVSLTSIHDDPS